MIWYHLVLQFDSTQAAAADRLRFFVNGQERTVTRTQGNDIPQNDPFWLTNINTRAVIGCSNHNGDFNPSSFFGYAAEINTIDGQVVAPTEFGELNANGVWVPRDVRLMVSRQQRISPDVRPNFAFCRPNEVAIGIDSIRQWQQLQCGWV